MFELQLYRPPNTLPKPNKRFLANIVRATDDHNQALIRQAERDAAERREIILRDNKRLGNYGHERERERDRLRVDGRIRQSRSRSRSESRLGSVTRSRSVERRPLRGNGGRGGSYDGDYSKESSSFLTRKPQRSLTSSPSVAATTSQASQPNTPVKIRGRGTITDSVRGSQMDKYFRPDYDPRTDTTYAEDESGWMVDFSDFEASLGRPNTVGRVEVVAKKKAKKGKKRKKDKTELGRGSKKKKRKRDSDTEDSSAPSSESSGSDVSTDSEEDIRRRRRRRRRRRHKEKKKRRSNKDDSANKEEPKEVGLKVREWDMAKFASGEWSPK